MVYELMKLLGRLSFKFNYTQCIILSKSQMPKNYSCKVIKLHEEF